MVRVLLLPDLGHVLGPGRVAVRHEAARGAHDVGQQLRHLAHVLLQGHVTRGHTTWGEKRSSLRPVRMSAVACTPWPRTAASMVLVSPCVSVPGLGCPVRCGERDNTVLAAWAQPSHSHACVVTLVGSSSHAPGQPSQPSPAQPAQPCRLQTGWTTSLIFMLLLYSPAQPRL